MSDLYSFRFADLESNKKNCLLIYSTSKMNLNALAKLLKNEVEVNALPKYIYLLSPVCCLITKEELEKEKTFFDECQAYIHDEENIFCIGFNESGELAYCNAGKLDGKLSKKILHQGMMTLFEKHSGLIVSHYGYHFVKPSGDHCNKFIRASNLLVSSTEVSFLAISLLPFLKKEQKHIYVDTSSISFLISIAIQESGKFLTSRPTIESFESYTALDKKYDFIEAETSIVFISATTSGSLVKRLQNESPTSKKQITTLFYTNLPDDQDGVFDISDALEDGIVSDKPNNCKFCKLGSKQIKIAGDQFLPENPKHEQLIIKKADFESGRGKFFGIFGASNVLKVDKISSVGSNKKEHFYIDIEKALELQDDALKKQLAKKLNKYISRDLEFVVALNDGGSEFLAEKVKSHIGKPSNKIQWLKSNELKEEAVKEKGSVLVVAGAITSGRSLLSISRKLRGIKSSSSIVYLVGFSKVQTKETLELLKKDLAQGGHELVILIDCPVPRVNDYTETYWDLERKKLAECSEEDPFGELDLSSASLLAKYYSNKSEECLFLPNPKNEPLKLRSTFAFWSDFNFPTDRLNAVTQADVYWTIQCVLHDLRIRNNGGGLASTYHTTVISPANFDRYNDGIIQACFLRAALPIELDYRIDPAFSRRMTDIILSIVNNWHNEQGEAALEFLMALWLQRLRLEKSHLEEICKINSSNMSPDIIFLFAKLDKLLNT